MEAVARIARVLGGKDVLGRQVSTWTDLEELVRDGLPKRALQVVARHAAGPGETTSDFVYRIVPAATFKRRRRLTPAESERTERLARIVALAEELWENIDQTRAFLNRPHPLLENQPPLVVARTELGARRVERLIHDIDHGLPL